MDSKSSSEINSCLHSIFPFAEHVKKSSTAIPTYVSPQYQIPDIGHRKEKEYQYSQFNMKSIYLEHNRQNPQCLDFGHLGKKCSKMQSKENEEILLGNIGTQRLRSNLVRTWSPLHPKTTQENINNQPSSHQESKHQITTHVEKCYERPLLIITGSFTPCTTNHSSSYINMIPDPYVTRIKSGSKTFTTDVVTEYSASTETSPRNKLEDDLKQLLLQEYFKCRQKRNRVYTNTSTSKDIHDVLDALYCNEADHQKNKLKRSGLTTQTTITKMHCDENQIYTQIESPNVPTKPYISNDTRLRATDLTKRFSKYTDMEVQLIQDTREKRLHPDVSPETIDKYTERPYDPEAPYIPTETRLQAADSPKHFDTYIDMKRIPIKDSLESRLHPDMEPDIIDIYTKSPSLPRRPHIRTDTRLRTADSAQRFDTYSEICTPPFQESLHPVIAPELIKEYTERLYGPREPYEPTETTGTRKRYNRFLDKQKRTFQEKREKRIRSEMTPELTDTYAKIAYVSKEPCMSPDQSLQQAADTTTRFDTFSDTQKRSYQDTRERILHPDVAPELIELYTKSRRVPYKTAETKLRPADLANRFDTISDEQQQPYQDMNGIRFYTDAAIPQAIDTTNKYVPKESYITTETKLRATDSTKSFDTFSDMQKQPDRDSRERRLLPDVAAPELIDKYTDRPYVSKESHILPETRLQAAGLTKYFDTKDLQKQPIQDTCEKRLHPFGCIQMDLIKFNVIIVAAPEIISIYAQGPSILKELYIPAETRLRATDSTKRIVKNTDMQRQPIQDTRERRFLPDMAPETIVTYDIKTSIPKKPYISSDIRLIVANSTKRFHAYTRRTSISYIPDETRLRADDSPKRFDTYPDMQRQPIQDRRKIGSHPDMASEIIDTYAQKPGVPKECYIPADRRFQAAESTQGFDLVTGMQRQLIQDTREGILHPDMAPDIINTYEQRLRVPKEPYIAIETRLREADSSKRFDTITDMQKQPIQEHYVSPETRLPVAGSKNIFDTIQDIQKQPIQEMPEKILPPDLSPELVDTYIKMPGVHKEPFVPTETKSRAANSTKHLVIISDMQKQPIQDKREKRSLPDVAAPEIIVKYAKKRSVPKESYIPAETRLRAAESTKGFDTMDLQKQPIQDTRADVLHSDVAPIIDTYTEKPTGLKEPYASADLRVCTGELRTLSDMQKQPIKDATEDRLHPEVAVQELIETYTEITCAPNEPYTSTDPRLRAANSTKEFDTVDLQNQPIQVTAADRLHADVAPLKLIDTLTKTPSISIEPYTKPVDAIADTQKQPIQDTREEILLPDKEPAKPLDTYTEKVIVPEEPIISSNTKLRTSKSTELFDGIPDMQKQPIHDTCKEALHLDMEPEIIDTHIKRPSVPLEPYISTDTRLRVADATKSFDTSLHTQTQPIKNKREEIPHPDVAPMIDTYIKKTIVIQKPHITVDSKLPTGEPTVRSDIIPDKQKQPIPETSEENLHLDMALPELMETYTKRLSVSEKPSEPILPEAESTLHLDTITNMQKKPIQDTPKERLHPYVQEERYISTDSKLLEGESAGFDTVLDMQKRPFPDRREKRFSSDVASELVRTYTEGPYSPGEPYTPPDIRLQAADSRERYDMQQWPIQDMCEERLHPNMAPEFGESYTRNPFFLVEPNISGGSRLRPEESIIRFDTISDMQRCPFPDRREKTFYSDTAPHLVNTYTERPHFQGEPYTPTDIRLEAAESRECFTTYYDMQQRAIQDMREERLHPVLAPELGDKYTRQPIFFRGSRLHTEKSMIRFDTILDMQKRLFPDRREKRFYSDVAPELEDTYIERPHFPGGPHYIPTDVRLRKPKLIDTYTEMSNISREPYIRTDSRLRAADSTKPFNTIMSDMPKRNFLDSRVYSDVTPEFIETYTENPYAPKQPYTAINSRLRAGHSRIRLDTEEELYLQQTASLSPMQRGFSRQTSTEKQSEQRPKLQDAQYFERSNIPRQEMTNLDGMQGLLFIQDGCIVVKGGRLLISNEGAGSEAGNKNRTDPELTKKFASPCRKRRLKDKCDKSSQCTIRRPSIFILHSARVPTVESKTNQTKADHTPSKQVHKTDSICDCKRAPKSETRIKVSKTDVTPCRRYHKKCANTCKCQFMQKKREVQSEIIDDEYQLRDVQYQPEQANKSVPTDATPDKREPKPDNKIKATDRSRCRNQQNKSTKGCQCRFMVTKTNVQPVRIDNKYLNIQQAEQGTQSSQCVCNHSPSCEQVPVCLIKHYMDLFNHCVHVPLCARVSLCWSVKSRSDLRSTPFTNLVERNTPAVPPPCMAVQTCDQRTSMWISHGKQSQEPDGQCQPPACLSNSIIRAPTFYSSNCSEILFSKMPFRRRGVLKSSASSFGKFLKIFSRHKRSS